MSDDAAGLLDAVRVAVENARNRSLGRSLELHGRYVNRTYGIVSDDINEYLSAVDACRRGDDRCERVVGGVCMFSRDTCAPGCLLDW